MTLSGLSIGSATLEPSFSPDVTRYTGTFASDATSLTISATKAVASTPWGNRAGNGLWCTGRYGASHDQAALFMDEQSVPPQQTETATMPIGDANYVEIAITLHDDDRTFEHMIVLTRES